MALPSRQPLAEVLSEARRTWANTRAACVTARQQSAAGPVQAHRIVALYDQLRRDAAHFRRIASTPGLADYARAQYADEGVDVAADFGAMTTAIDSAVAWILAALPRDAGGYPALHEVAQDGSIVLRTFTSAQTAGLRTRLDAIIATIAAP